MRIFIGTDHAGFELKEKLKQYLVDLGYKIKDLGARTFNPEDDYPDFMASVAKAVAKNPRRNRGIVIGGSGQGEAMSANKIKGVRAAVVYDEYSARMSREHNDANIMALGARRLTFAKAKYLTKIWLETPFSNAKRHKRRIKKIKKIEKENLCPK